MGEPLFVEKIKQLLQKDATDQALELFDANPAEIEANSCDLLPIIAGYLTADNELKKPSVFKCCQGFMAMLAEHGRPEEVILEFIEAIEIGADDMQFVALLRGLTTVINRVPELRLTTLASCFNAITMYLNQIQAPDLSDLAAEERLLLDSHDDVIRLLNIYQELDTFAEQLIAQPEASEGRLGMVAVFLVDLLRPPFGHLNLDAYKETKPEARLIAERLVRKIVAISDPFPLVELMKTSVLKLSEVSVGVFYFILFEGDFAYPRVYRKLYLVHLLLPFVNQLLVDRNQALVEKGLHLSRSLTRDLLGIPSQVLELIDQSQFCRALANVVIYNQNAEVRRGALAQLRHYLWAFDPRGRYLIVLNLHRRLGHSGIKGYLIMQFKEMVQENPNWCLGAQLFHLVEEFTTLAMCETTDLVEESDQIISTLNFLRFMVISNPGVLAAVFGHLEDAYFAPLKQGLSLSKEHYRLWIRKVAEAPKPRSKLSAVTVSGTDLEEMPSKEKLHVLHMSLNALDLIDSLLNRVVEIVHSIYPTWCSHRPASTQPPDDDLRDKILSASMPFVVEHGWSRTAIGAGAQTIGYPGVIHGLFPNGGADLLNHFQRTCNARLLTHLEQLDKIDGETPGEFVEKALKHRLEMLVPYLSRWPQAIAIMSLPPNVAQALAMLLTTVDDICHYAGDRSVNINWYLRRLGVAGVYKATELYLIQDKSPENEATWQFLNRRLAEAVQIHEVLCKTEIRSSGPQDAITSAFVTARNILGLSWSR